MQSLLSPLYPIFGKKINRPEYLKLFTNLDDVMFKKALILIFTTARFSGLKCIS